MRLVGGRLGVAQAEVLGLVAETMGDGCLSLTSRGNVQLRGLSVGAGRELGRWLESCGLLPSRLHERVRNVVASPFAGLDGRGLGAVEEWLVELDELLCESEVATGLSGRFLFAVDDGRGDVAALGADVVLRAEGAGGALLLLGDQAAVRVRSADGPRAAVLAAELFVERAGRTDDTAASPWRVRELTAPLTPDAEQLCAHLAAYDIDARPASGTETTRTPSATPPPGTVHDPDGGRSLHVLAPLGRLTVDQWRLLARYAPQLRLTPWRGVVLPGVDDRRAASALAEAGLVVDPDSPWHGVGACTGRPGCAKSLADVRTDAAHTLALASAPAPLPVYWSGCERRCGHPVGSWIDVTAAGADGYQIAVRGVAGTPSTATSATPAELATALAAVPTVPTTPGPDPSVTE